MEGLSQNDNNNLCVILIPRPQNFIILIEQLQLELAHTFAMAIEHQGWDHPQ